MTPIAQPPAPLPASFESLLVERVVAQVGARGGAIGDRDALLGPIRAVLDAPHFDVRERLLVGAAADKGGSDAAKDCWLAARVERALAAGLAVGAKQAGLAGELAPPHVVVRRSELRATVGIEDAGAGDDGQASSAPSTFLPEPGERSVLVLADDRELARLQHGRPAPADANAPRSVAAKAVAEVHFIDLAVALRRVHSTMARLFDPKSALLRAEPAGSTTAEVQEVTDDVELAANTLFHGKYEIVRSIGRGGFGTVYEARDVRIGSRVAIKLLNEKAANDAAELEHFVGEARRVTRLENAHIVGWKVFDEDEHGRRYFVMELLEGEDLGQVLAREQRLKPKRVARILLQVADALRAAHFLPDGGSILHLDLKPKNIFLLPGLGGVDDEHVKVIDFGIGQFIGGTLVEPLPAESTPASSAAPLSDLDRADGDERAGESIRMRRNADSTPQVDRVAACTPEYASPEHCAHMLVDAVAEPLDGRADLYSLGVIGFQMLTGQLPFAKPRRRREYLRLHRNVPPKRVDEAGVRVPRALARFVNRCLEKDRDRRWRNAQDAYDALYRIVHPSPLRLIAQYVLPPALVAAAAVWALWPGGASRPFDIYADVDGVEQLVGSTGLWLGPARHSATLRLSGATRGAAEPELVASPDDDTPPLEDWYVLWRDSEHVVVERPANTASFDQSIYLRLRAGNEPARYSAPFELHWIAAMAWNIADVGVRGLDSRRLDPVGQTLELTVRGATEAVVSASIEIGQSRHEANPDTVPAGADARTYRATLDEVEWVEGHNRLRVVVSDRAGMQRIRDVDLDVALEPLAMPRATLAGQRVGGISALSNATVPSLRVELNRPARVDWSIVDSTERELANGASDISGKHAIVLPSLGALGGGRTYSGVVVLRADDSSAVAHTRTERGRIERRLPFVFHAEMPELLLRLAVPGRSDGLELVDGGERFVSLRSATLMVARANAVPVEVEIELARPGETAHVERRQLSDPAVTSASFELGFPADGAYRLTARAYRLEGTEGTALEPEFASVVTIGVDTSEPSIVIDFPRSVVRAETTTLPLATVSLRDAETGGASAPVDVQWELERIELHPRILRAGTLESPLASNERREIALPLPWSDLAGAASSDADGRYVVRYFGRDAAGNEACTASAEYEVALHGPLLQLRAPTARLAWSPGESGAFEIEALADDPNDTASIEGELVQGSRNETRRPFALERASMDAEGATLWRGRLALDPSWSEADVLVRLVARDAQGARTEQIFERRLGVIERHIPAIARVCLAEGSVARVALVRGNREVEYVFGGRADEDEEALFRKMGLGHWRTHATGRSWQVHYPPRAIPDYYLDQREVSVREMLVFVRRREAWNDPALWPAGSPPSDARRAELEASLSAFDADMPATGVTWSEANAFARSVGKRLPSYVEWEYAVRGGPRYRPYSCAESASRPYVEGSGPHPVEHSLDVSAQNGLRDLCGNVAEWTSTPAWFPDGREVPRNPALHVAEWRAQFLEPALQAGWDLAEHYWVVGGSWRTDRFHFFVVDRRQRECTSDAVGFRCAVSADVVLGGIENPRAPVRFEEVIP